MIFRRLPEWIWALALFALLLPATASAVDLVAVILPGDLPRYQEAHKAFEQVLNVGGKGKVKLIVKRPNPDKMSLANDIRRFAGAGAKAIITYGAPATLVAQKEAKGVPVIFADVCDPVSLGIVKTLQSPGADLTGATCETPVGELFDALSLVKQPGTIGALFSAEDPASVLQTSTLEGLGNQRGFKTVKASANSPKEVAKALQTLTASSDAIYVADSMVAQLAADEIIQAATAAGKPIISQAPGLADKGALLTLEADPAEQGKLIAVHTLQIISGQQAHLLPVRSAKKINLVANKKTAAALGLAIPPGLLSSAGRIIE